jgi:hypothetical protein
MRHSPVKIVLVALVAITLAVLGLREILIAIRSDETRVLLVLEDVARLASKKDGGGVVEYLDPDFTHSGGPDYVTVKRIVIGYLFQAKSAEAKIEAVSPVKIEGDIATVTVRAHVKMKVQGMDLTLIDAGLKGDTFVVTLKRHESYFRCTGVRAATEDDEGTTQPAGEAGDE